SIASLPVGTFNPTGHIIIFGRAGNDTITINPDITKTVEVHGEDGNDTITGGGGDDILIGGAGNDVLNGTNGRDLLIGDAGTDSMTGGLGDDILIGATTDFDDNSATLSTIMKEWTRTDLTYTDRVDHITGKAGGMNGTFFFKKTTITADAEVDTL